MDRVLAAFDQCRLCELFETLRSVCVNYARCGDTGDVDTPTQIRKLRESIVAHCSRPVMPLDLNMLEDAAIHGGRCFVHEVVEMAEEYIRKGGRVVFLRHSSLNSLPEIVGDFMDADKLHTYAERWK